MTESTSLSPTSSLRTTCWPDISCLPSPPPRSPPSITSYNAIARDYCEPTIHAAAVTRREPPIPLLHPSFAHLGVKSSVCQQFELGACECDSELPIYQLHGLYLNHCYQSNPQLSRGPSRRIYSSLNLHLFRLPLPVTTHITSHHIPLYHHSRRLPLTTNGVVLNIRRTSQTAAEKNPSHRSAIPSPPPHHETYFRVSGLLYIRQLAPVLVPEKTHTKTLKRCQQYLVSIPPLLSHGIHGRFKSGCSLREQTTPRQNLQA